MGGDGNFGGGDGAVRGAERPIRPGGDPDLRKLKFDCQLQKLKIKFPLRKFTIYMAD